MLFIQKLFCLSFTETQFWRQKILTVANRYSSKLTFAISDEEEFKNELEDAGLGESGLEVNIVVYGEDKRRYPMSPETYDEFDEDSLSNFLDKFLKGESHFLYCALWNMYVPRPKLRAEARGNLGLVSKKTGFFD